MHLMAVELLSVMDVRVGLHGGNWSHNRTKLREIQKFCSVVLSNRSKVSG